jgi:predicted CxxxxCH...CXXCH cytochrome family protein
MQLREPIETRRAPSLSSGCARSPLALTTRCAAWSCAICLAFAAGGCERSALSDGLPNTQDCSSCHGSKVNAAPPKAVNGSQSTADIGVGAHQSHLVAGHVAAPVACDECHRVPTDLLSHPDPLGRPAPVIFGTNATRYGAAPVWNRTDVSCSDTYCHGGILSGAASRPAPVWTNLDGSQLRCRACHGCPPTGNHPTSNACHTCHGDVVSPNGIIKDLTRHINGYVDYHVSVADAGAGGSGGTSTSSTAVAGAGGGS